MQRIFFLLLFAFALSGVYSCASDSGKDNAAQQSEKPKKQTPGMKKMERKKSEKRVATMKPGLTSINFRAKDDLPVNANMYYVSDNVPVLVLCHQARSSKDEYAETAKKLNSLGFNCIALDQRSGGTALGGKNETAVTAKKMGKGTEFLDAEQDIIAAVNYASGKFKRDVILVGSSYSASLALKVGHEHNKVKAVAAFSPGEYFKKQSKTFVRDAINGMEKPVFLTCAPNEGEQVNEIAAVIQSPDVFIPKQKGVHGARALWKSDDGSDDYWDHFVKFLSKVK